MTLLLSVLVDVTVVLAIALVVVWRLRARSAALRHAVLAAAIAAAALSPLLELIVPQVPVVTWRDAAPAVASGTALPAGGTAQGSVAPGAGSAATVPFSWSGVLLGIWLTGALAVLAGLLVGLVRLARLITRCLPVRSGPWREIADELTRAYGLRRRVDLLQSGDRSLLVSCGVLRPKILLPAGADAWADERRRIILAHELAHVRRRDAAVQLVAELLRACAWFHPLAWVACRRLRQESEYACDDAVLRAGTAGTQYATHLLEVARHAAGRPRAWASASAIAQPSTLERRIAAMLNHQRNRAPVTRAISAAAALAAAAVIVPLAAAGVAPPPNPPVAMAADVALTAPPATREPPPAAAATPRPEPAVRTAEAVAAQEPAALSGTVLDQTGGRLPGSRVTLTDTSTGAAHAATTNASGRFVFPKLPPARYELAVNLVGFAPVVDVVSLEVGAAAERVITLPIAAFRESVAIECSPAAPAARTRTSPAAHEGLLARVRRASTGAIRAFFPVLSAQQPATPIRVGGSIRVPQKVTMVTPACPDTLTGSETVVRLRGRIGTDGILHDLAPIPAEPGRELPPAITERALDAVRQWTFTVAELNRRPVEMDYMVTLLFRRG
jgi:beta-lactamase regulating signal transducer with metallopeptidase domain